MSMIYSVFTYNNDSVMVLPGNRFSKKELLFCLHEMDANIDNNLDKNSLIHLYDSYLSDNRNKLKIYNRLKKDTEMQLSKLEISQRQSLLASNANANTLSNNSKYKVSNISTEVKPFYEQQNINKSSKGEIFQNTIISNDNNYNCGYSDNQMGKNSSNNNQNYSRNVQNINNSNDTNSYNYSNSQSQNRNQNQINYQRNYDNSMNRLNNSGKNKYSMNSNMNDKYITLTKPYQEEEINTDVNRNNQSYIQQNSNVINQKSFTNEETPNPNFQESKNSVLRSQNINNNNYGNSNSNINYSINNSYNNNNSSINSSNQMNPYGSQNQNNNFQRIIIEERNQSQFPIDENQSQNMVDQPYKREPDEESVFSMFSVFKDFKNTLLYKNRKEICINLLISLIVILVAIGSLFFIYKTWDSITNFFAEFFNVLMDPQRILNGILGFISSVLFGSVRYFYVSIPLIVSIVLLVIYYRKYLFKKRCKEILEKILEYLKNNDNRENNIIYEEEIYRRFAQVYGITQEEFFKKYIRSLYNLRRNYPLKTYSNNINGRVVNFWALS